jgi:hypothetical protein
MNDRILVGKWLFGAPAFACCSLRSERAEGGAAMLWLWGAIGRRALWEGEGEEAPGRASNRKKEKKEMSTYSASQGMIWCVRSMLLYWCFCVHMCTAFLFAWVSPLFLSHIFALSLSLLVGRVGCRLTQLKYKKEACPSFPSLSVPLLTLTQSPHARRKNEHLLPLHQLSLLSVLKIAGCCFITHACTLRLCRLLPYTNPTACLRWTDNTVYVWCCVYIIGTLACFLPKGAHDRPICSPASLPLSPSPNTP